MCEVRLLPPLLRRLGVGAAFAGILAITGPPTTAEAEPPARGSADRFSVTLVTGDRVTVRHLPGGRHAVDVAMGKGRERIPFTTRHTPSGLLVTPADAVPLLAGDRLDPRLFDVLLLKRLGYDDSRRKDLPLMISGGRAPAGARTLRTLPSLGIAVVQERKRDAVAFWAGRKRAPGKLWLVGKLRPTLDTSVAQVGAPSAWKAGLTGSGVTVAVLDTGYDAKHPDLAGVVAQAKDFTRVPAGVQDTNGHGTHVASTIAGRGTASKGRFTGVAKGAKLAIGKVCDSDGCPEDAILAGIEWAASTGAKVVNLSLGGPAGEGVSPLEQAVAHHTAKSGMLFVISAGNDGPDPETVGSPGTADAALTVGSVTKSGALSDFSSRGPRVTPSRRSDYAVKPDLTAPGQDIVAARAAGTLEGIPGAPQYARLSGTSMASPHVAGAAAILAGKHPTWTPAQLKAALMSSAAPRAGLTVYQQGSGRLDVARAVTQTVHASAGSISLGYFPWPNAGAPTVHKPVTYTNTGTAAVTLKLDLATDAPAGMITVSPPTLTVPAGRTATATLTVTPAGARAGLYGGALTATAPAGIAVRTALGAYQEPESYDLSVTTLGRDGKAGVSEVMIADVRTGTIMFDSINGTLVRRLPAGRYTVAAATYDGADADADVTTSVRDVQLGRVNEVVLDARKGKPLTVAVDRQDAVIAGSVAVAVSQRTTQKGGGQSVSAASGHVYAEPSGPVPGMEFAVSTAFVKRGTGGPDQPPTPYTYRVLSPVTGQIPANLGFRFADRDFAAVKRVISRQGPREQRYLYSHAFTDLTPTPTRVFPLGGLRERVDHHLVAPGVRYETVFDSHQPGVGASTVRAEPVTYTAGQRVEAWNTAVFGPAFDPAAAPSREGNTLDGIVPLVGDSQPGHSGTPSLDDTGETVLRRDGKVVMSVPDPGYLPPTVVPPGVATFRLETRLRRAAAPFSTQIHAAWTFRSGHGAKPVVLPLGVVRYSPPLNADNKAPSAGAFTIPLRYERSPGSTVAPLRSIAVQVSYDGGKTWTAAALSGAGDRRVATVRHPGRAGFASLRATAVDTAGNSVEQTYVNAYALT